MKQHIIARAIELACYIRKTKATVRDTAKYFNISKSTVHKDVSHRLKHIDKQLYAAVQQILNYNLSQRHLRGGKSTQLKYKRLAKWE